MKKFLVIMGLTLASSTFANTVSVYRFDDVDAIKANGKSISVEDLRDGFVTIKGIQVNEETVSIAGKSKVFVILRNSSSNRLLRSSTMAARKGGDMGGG